MKLRMISSLVSSVLLAAGMALMPAAQAQSPATTMVIGGSPDVVYVDSNGNMYDMTPMSGARMDTTAMGDMNTGGMNMGTTGTGAMGSHMAMTGMGPMKVEGQLGDWVPAVNVPVFSGVVTSSDPVLQTATVRSVYGYAAVPTTAGTRVLYRDKLVSWLTVPIGAQVQLPISYLVDGPVPHRIHINNQLMTSMGMGNMGMGTNGMGTGMASPGTTGSMTESTTTTTMSTTTTTPSGGRRRNRRNRGGTGGGTSDNTGGTGTGTGGTQ